MAIPTPAEVAASHARRCDAEVKAVTSRIIEAMHATDNPKRFTVDTTASLAAQDALVTAFRFAGWNIEFCDNQRDGAWVQVTAL